LNAYADTSFLVSLYAPDSNSREAIRRMDNVSLPLLFTSFGEVELANAFQLLLFRKQLEGDEVRASYNAFRQHVRSGVIVVHSMTEEVFETSRLLAMRYTARLGVRTLDILHVASALVLGGDVFHTFDRNQKKLAAAVGLEVG
jgi:predicted nucleic acid-binding protein